MVYVFEIPEMERAAKRTAAASFCGDRDRINDPLHDLRRRHGIRYASPQTDVKEVSVITVEKVSEDRKEVQILVGNVLFTFRQVVRLQKKRIMLISKHKPGAMVRDPHNLWVPAAQYQDAYQRAAAIINGRSGSRDLA